MVSWSENLAHRDRSFAVKIKIEGCGHWVSNVNLAATDGDGRTEFWSFFPDYINGQLAIHRDYLTEMPDLMKETVDPLGGFPTLGTLTFSLLDKGDYLTGLLRTERPPCTTLDGAIDANDTFFDVLDVDTGILETSVIFIGSEAMRVTSIVGDTVTVLRGYLGTDAQSHDDGKPVFISIPFLRNRLVEMYMVPLDGTRADEQHVGTYAIDQISWDSDSNIWTFSAKGQLKHLHRVAPIKTRGARVTYVYGDDPKAPDLGLVVEPIGREHIGNLQIWPTENGTRFHVRNGKEIAGVRSSTLANGVTLGVRGVLGTKIEDIETNGILYECFVADKNGFSGFRYSPGATPSESRVAGTWTKTAHWVDLCLIIMTSSADAADELELVNYDATAPASIVGNYSSLPAGYGLGLPHSKIDWASWGEVKTRTRDYEFPNFTYGGEAGVSFGELIERHFLKPLGAYLSISNGKAKIILPRIPLAGEAQIELGTDDILTKKVGELLYQPRLKLQQNIGQHTGRINYEIGPEKVRLSTSSADYIGTYGQRGYYSNDDKPITIEVPSGRPEDALLWYKASERKLYRWHRPNFEITADIDFGHFNDMPVGGLAQISLEELPNLNAGTRGWESVTVEVLDREPKLDPVDGAFIAMHMLGYGSDVRAGRICPSAQVVSVASNIATCVANRYTEPDAFSGLPVLDVSAFEVDDVVKLMSADGAFLASGATQIVTAIGEGSNELELDGNFSGSLATDTIIVYAEHDNQIAQQTATRVSYADQATQTVGSGNVTPWVFAEP